MYAKLSMFPQKHLIHTPGHALIFHLYSVCNRLYSSSSFPLWTASNHKEHTANVNHRIRPESTKNIRWMRYIITCMWWKFHLKCVKIQRKKILSFFSSPTKIWNNIHNIRSMWSLPPPSLPRKYRLNNIIMFFWLYAVPVVVVKW